MSASQPNILPHGDRFPDANWISMPVNIFLAVACFALAAQWSFSLQPAERVIFIAIGALQFYRGWSTYRQQR